MSLLDEELEVEGRMDLEVLTQKVLKLNELCASLSKTVEVLEHENASLKGICNELKGQVNSSWTSYRESANNLRTGIQDISHEQRFITRNYLTHVMNLSWVLHDVLDYIHKKYPEDERIRKSMAQVEHIEKENYNYLNLWDDEMDKMLKEEWNGKIL